jgi:hypothetical protein
LSKKWFPEIDSNPFPPLHSQFTNFQRLQSSER